jgi:Ca2+/Na+ antiporter
MSSSHNFFLENHDWVWKNLTQTHFSRFMVAFICLMNFMFYKNKINWGQTICKKMFTTYFFVFLLVKFEYHNASRSHHTYTNEASSAHLPHTKNFSFTHPQTNVHGQYFGNVPLLEQSKKATYKKLHQRNLANKCPYFFIIHDDNRYHKIYVHPINIVVILEFEVTLWFIKLV